MILTSGPVENSCSWRMRSNFTWRPQGCSSLLPHLYSDSEQWGDSEGTAHQMKTWCAGGPSTTRYIIIHYILRRFLIRVLYSVIISEMSEYSNKTVGYNVVILLLSCIYTALFFFNGGNELP